VGWAADMTGHLATLIIEPVLATSDFRRVSHCVKTALTICDGLAKKGVSVTPALLGYLEPSVRGEIQTALDKLHQSMETRTAQETWRCTAISRARLRDSTVSTGGQHLDAVRGDITDDAVMLSDTGKHLHIQTVRLAAQTGALPSPSMLATIQHGIVAALLKYANALVVTQGRSVGDSEGLAIVCNALHLVNCLLPHLVEIFQGHGVPPVELQNCQVTLQLKYIAACGAFSDRRALSLVRDELDWDRADYSETYVDLERATPTPGMLKLATAIARILSTAHATIGQEAAAPVMSRFIDSLTELICNADVIGRWFPETGGSSVGQGGLVLLFLDLAFLQLVTNTLSSPDAKKRVDDFSLQLIDEMCRETGASAHKLLPSPKLIDERAKAAGENARSTLGALLGSGD